MLSCKNIKGLLLCKSAVLISLVFIISGCSSVDMTYISRDKIKTAAFAQERPRYATGDSRPMQLGAIRMTSKDGHDGEGRLLILQRKKGVYMAETKIDSDSKRRYFFSIGIDPRSKTPAIGFRMEF